MGPRIGWLVFGLALSCALGCSDARKHERHARTLQLADSVGGPALQAAVRSTICAEGAMGAADQHMAEPTKWVWSYGSYPWLKVSPEEGVFEMHGRCWSRRLYRNENQEQLYPRLPAVVATVADGVAQPAAHVALKSDDLAFATSTHVTISGEVEFENGGRQSVAVRLGMARMGGTGRISVMTSLSFMVPKENPDDCYWKPVRVLNWGYLLGREVELQVDAKGLRMHSTSGDFRHDFLNRGWPTPDSATQPVRAIRWQRIALTADTLPDYYFGRQKSRFRVMGGALETVFNPTHTDTLHMLPGVADLQAADAAIQRGDLSDPALDRARAWVKKWSVDENGQPTNSRLLLGLGRYLGGP